MRKITIEDKNTILVADPTDFAEATTIVNRSLVQTLNNLAEKAIAVHKVALELYEKTNDPVGITSREIADSTTYSQNRTREIMESLIKAGFWTKDRSTKEHRYIPTKRKVSALSTSIIEFTEEEFKEWYTDNFPDNNTLVSPLVLSCHADNQDISSNTVKELDNSTIEPIVVSSTTIAPNEHNTTELAQHDNTTEGDKE